MNRILTLLLVAALAAAPAAADDKPLPQSELNYGYASVYGTARGLRHSDKIFLIKFESPQCEAVVKDLSETMGRIAKDLEALAQEDPKVKLDNEGLPEIERRKRDAVTRDRLLSFKPLQGRTGTNFERTLLLSESGALNQLQHLIAELDAADPDARRSKVLKQAHKEVMRLYGDVVELLNREHFKGAASQGREKVD